MSMLVRGDACVISATRVGCAWGGGEDGCERFEEDGDFAQVETSSGLGGFLVGQVG